MRGQSINETRQHSRHITFSTLKKITSPSGDERGETSVCAQENGVASTRIKVAEDFHSPYLLQSVT